MRKGLVSLGAVTCSVCHRVIPYLERYLGVEEKEGVEAEGGDTLCYCIQCAKEKGYTHYKTEKDEKTLTFFPG